MNLESARKNEKNIGYVLLVLGLALIIIPAITAFVIFLLQTEIPQFVPTPQGQGDNLVGLIAFSNVCMLFFIFVIIVWAGSIISSRAVTMIKDVRLKLVGKSLREARTTASKVVDAEA